jgi:hypothetical protein
MYSHININPKSSTWLIDWKQKWVEKENREGPHKYSFSKMERKQ